MKKLAILVIALALVTGFVMADPGIKPVPETQGISTVTNVDGTATMTSSTTLDLRTTNEEALPTTPPLDDVGSVYYSAYYEEQTDAAWGDINYTKNLDIETAAQIDPLSNIKATKIINYAGLLGGEITSSDEISLMSDGNAFDAPDSPSYCGFGSTETEGISWPSFCNYIQMENSIKMSVADVATGTDARFIIPSADEDVVVNMDIRVVASFGTASASLDSVIREGRTGTVTTDQLFEELKYKDSTTVDGFIIDFSKDMQYASYGLN